MSPLPLAADEFTLEDLRLEGLQRVSPGSVFAQLGIQAGERITSQALTQAGKRLYATGLFDDLSIYRDEGVVIFQLQERPTLRHLEITGNSKIPTEDLQTGLSQAGLEEGQIFQRSTLDQIKLELERMYHAQGRYNARIDSEVEELPRNQVAVTLSINEGSVAQIRRINLVGNHAFDRATLLNTLELQEERGWTLFSSASQYSREKLSGDLERLRSWYLDRGYLDFEIESTQVSISPDKQSIFLTINLHEGQPYTLSEVALAGELILTQEDLLPLSLLKAGDTFSRSAMTSSSDLMRRRLGVEGYTFAQVQGVPEIDAEQLQVRLTYLFNPGRRVYVNQVNFRGNTGTNDEVLRRELLQLEGASANTDLIDASKARLERLGYFSKVDVQTQPVPGRPDLVDVTYEVEEQPSGSASASIGFSQSSGIVFGLGLSQSNFLGSGNNVSLNASKSDYQTNYGFSYMNPYYTLDGVSRGFNIFYRATDYDSRYSTNSRYTTDTYGGNVTYGYALSLNSRVTLSLGVDNTEVKDDPLYPIAEIEEFNQLYGLDFFNYRVTGRWIQNRLNRGILATAGSYQRVSLEVAVPGSDYEFYKAEYQGQKYFPIGNSWSLKFRTRLAYGDGYGDYDRLPFYEHYYAGGLNSVRGYRSSRLGPRTEHDSAFGGNILLETGMDLIFPLPFGDSSAMQTSLFVDAGNVFTDRCYMSSTHCQEGIELDELRGSVGISLTWITGIGPLVFSIAQPFNDQPQDETEVFQFSLGQTF